MLAASFVLAVQVLAQAQPPGTAPPLNSPPNPDRSPTAWACTVDTLIAGKDCLFEAASDPVTDHPAQRAQNIRFAQQLSPAACARATKPAPGTPPDKVLQQICDKELSAAAAEQCGLDGKAVLVDGAGRFTTGAQDCYRALANVLQRSALMSSLASGCCRCMASQGCKVNPISCYANMSRGAPSAQERACMTAACKDECGDVPSAGGKAVETSAPAEKVRRRIPAHAL